MARKWVKITPQKGKVMDHFRYTLYICILQTSTICGTMHTYYYKLVLVPVPSQRYSIDSIIETEQLDKDIRI